jgi:2-polyprenyl-6-methoxyphenol hydroxylase-like FAD-dependent oxidoreductase
VTPQVVLGDGPAGCAAARALRLAGHPVALSGRGRVHPPGTLELLSGRAASALVTLGWYDAVVAWAQPCDAVVSRWGTPVYDERPALLEPYGHGWIVDRHRLDPLLRSLARSAGAVPGTGEPTVLATGQNAAGEWWPLGPDQVTLTAVVPSRPELCGRLVVESDVGGWWSALDDGTRGAVSWTTPAGPDRSGLGRAWSAALATGPAWLPGLTHATLAIRPSRSRVAVATDVPVRVGDAALSVDPLSGHGLTLALEGAVRCLDPDQPAWLRAQAEELAEAGRAAYA